MALAKKSVTLTNQGGTFTIAVGSETFTFSSADFLSIYDGRRNLDMLFVQVIQQLQSAGVNPNTATFAQIKTAVEAATYYWGN